MHAPLSCKCYTTIRMNQDDKKQGLKTNKTSKILPKSEGTSHHIWQGTGVMLSFYFMTPSDLEARSKPFFKKQNELLQNSFRKIPCLYYLHVIGDSNFSGFISTNFRLNSSQPMPSAPKNDNEKENLVK